MSFLAWVIVGLIAGILAKWAVPGEGPGGIVGDMIVGILGGGQLGGAGAALSHGCALGRAPDA